MSNKEMSAGTAAQKSDAAEVTTSSQTIANALVVGSPSRIIKFRAWDGKEIILPEYADKEDFHLFADGTIVETHEYGYERHELTSSRDKNWVVMQFTGRSDAEINGTDVFEGDIIENCDTKELQIVYWNEKEAAWFCQYIDDKKRTVSLADSLGNLNKVVGNIFSNPEMLSGELLECVQ